MSSDPLRSYENARARVAPPMTAAAAGVAVRAAPAWQDAAVAAPAAAESVMGPLAWALSLAIASLVLVVVLLPWFVLQLPVDYFVASRQELRAERTPIGWVWRVLRNVLGLCFVLAGAAMLVLPGQGLLTILIGLLLLEFPGKRALERRLVARPAIKAFLDRIRARRGVPPLEVDGP
jgi:hypothetical protein